MAKLIDLGEKSDNNKIKSPIKALEQVKEDITNGEFKGCDRLIICLWTRDEDGNMITGYNAAGLSLSESVALLEIVKKMVLDSLGFE